MELVERARDQKLDPVIGRDQEIRNIIDGVRFNEKLGVCRDTCHLWEGGYDIVNHLDDVLDEFDGEEDLYYDDVFKEEEDIDEPYDDVEPEDGYYTNRHRNDDEDDISFIDKYDL